MNLYLMSSSSNTAPTTVPTSLYHVSGSTGNGTATFAISPRKVKQISDPVQQILNVLHKVIYISQLPPSLTHNPRRTIVDRFKRALFMPNTSSAHLKTELKKLASSSADFIDLNFGNFDLNNNNTAASHDRSPSNGSAIDHESEYLSSILCPMNTYP